MNQLCEKIGLEIGSICFQWLLQATDRCTKLAFGHVSQGFNLLKSVKDLFFSGAENVTFSLHPGRIELAACPLLIRSIITDYAQTNLRYLADLEENAMLRRVIISWFGFMILAVFTLILIYINGKMKKPSKGHNLFSRDCKKLTRLSSERIVHRHKGKDEFKRQAKVRNHPSSVSSSIMMLKVRSKAELLKIIISNSPQSTGRFYGSLSNHLNHLKTKYEFKTQILKKALTFLGENVKQLLVFIVIDEDPVYGDDTLPSSSPSLSPISTDSSQQSSSPRPTSNPSRRGSLRKSLFTLGSGLPIATKKK